MPRTLAELPWADLTTGPFTPSPANWSEQVLYFLLVDRFSDGREDGYRDVAAASVRGTTPALTAGDVNTALATDDTAEAWRAAGKTWVGGTFEGIRSKLGYLKRLGVTTLWISPVLKQRRGAEQDYHGYAVQDFLAVDPHFGTEEAFVALVRDVHAAGLSVILDVVFNHAGDVFAYLPGDDRPWDGTGRRVQGWRDASGEPTLPFPEKLTDPQAGVWPAELQDDGVFTCRGPIADWDHDPEYREGDFHALKDIHQGTGGLDDYRPSTALRHLIRAYQYWVATADLDGLRIDTVKHMDPGATRFVASAMHEFGRRIGKTNFFLLGEIVGPRPFAIATMEQTGLDAAIGLADLQEKLDDVIRGRRDPQDYFALFRNSALVGHGSHTWIGERVVTSIDDHDQVRKGSSKSRFAADPEGRALAFAGLAMNVTTLGMPCVYYGSEQGLDGAGGDDRYLREAMFGGAFGAFRSTGRHCFDETHPLYVRLAEVLALRRTMPALRYGRQYQREISADGVTFGLPQAVGGGRITSIVAWSRVLADTEMVCALNTDTATEHTAWVTVDAEIHGYTSALTYRYSTDPARVGMFAPVQSRSGRAVQITVPPAGFVILA